MSWYERYCLPHIIHLACGLKAVQQQRNRVVPYARGKVLEIGMGSGLNIPFYDKGQVDLVWGLEPSLGMRTKAQAAIHRAPFEVRWLDQPCEQLPLDDCSVDTIVLTYTLCTIPDWHLALQQMRRVLRPEGKLLFCEHGLAPDAGVRKWQNRLDPLWGKLAGGCHLNRPIPEYINASGFSIEHMDTAYITGPRFAAFNYWGFAQKF